MPQRAASPFDIPFRPGAVRPAFYSPTLFKEANSMPKQTKRAPKPSKRDRNNGKTKAATQSHATFAVADLMRKNAQATPADRTSQRAG